MTLSRPVSWKIRATGESPRASRSSPPFPVTTSCARVRTYTPARTPLDLSTHQRADGTWIVTVAGEIDMSNAGAFHESLAQARAKAEEGEGCLVVDLQAAEYLDTAGLTTLFAHAPGFELIASPLIAPVLTISGLADLVTVHGLAGEPDGS